MWNGEDLKGKTIVSTAGTTNIKAATDLNVSKNMGMNIIPANGHPEAFQMVETGRAVAFVMDDILLASLAAQSRTPGDYEISATGLSVEPYGIMVRKDDKAFKAVADRAMQNVYKSGQINGIWEKWFQKAIPPKGINMGLPMTAAFKKGALQQCSVFGPTCDALDVVSMSEQLPGNLELGDLLYSENIGAYSHASATYFNGFPPAEVIHVNR